MVAAPFRQRRRAAVARPSGTSASGRGGVLVLVRGGGGGRQAGMAEALGDAAWPGEAAGECVGAWRRAALGGGGRPAQARSRPGGPDLDQACRRLLLCDVGRGAAPALCCAGGLGGAGGDLWRRGWTVRLAGGDGVHLRVVAGGRPGACAARSPVRGCCSGCGGVPLVPI